MLDGYRGGGKPIKRQSLTIGDNNILMPLSMVKLKLSYCQKQKHQNIRYKFKGVNKNANIYRHE